MPSLNLTDFLSFMGPTEVSAAILAGVILGFIYLAERWAPNIDAPLQAFVAGECFLAPLAIARLIDGAPAWSRVLSTCVLWALFCVCVWLGVWMRCHFRPIARTKYPPDKL